ncbi:hypothetical protein A1O3_06052 [Capronia epimyces CBS 606.96]|uniref:DUF7924 domain-containing protein n=1 Tax=Capronia epimyces CBS 606.96 TaxID=1182542 RepID=W9YIW8_9EURO|nr:uncharacterized protein A1O3_06052 [Capronia epimyces CBS 606.96]EXJ82239.1 hypothetical protein A1O3_06052 [Capronia epimyces CBS 606.96]
MSNHGSSRQSNRSEGRIAVPRPAKSRESPQGIKEEQKGNPSQQSTRLRHLAEANEAQLTTSTPLPPSPDAHILPTVLQSSPLGAETQQLYLPSRKRPLPAENTFPHKAVRLTQKQTGSITHWAETHHWPQDFCDNSGDISHLIARKRSTPTSDVESVTSKSRTPSDQRTREEKTAPYRDSRYEALLELHGSFMVDSKLGINYNSKTLIQNLFQKEQPIPKDSLFRDDLFQSTCRKIRNRNEARVLQDISQLIVPSAEQFATYGAHHLNCLVESVNEGWNNSITITEPRPQPDYAVGFARSAFTDEQLQKFSLFVGGLYDQSFFMGTWYMYFPFFTAECGTGGNIVADRQNAHSMTLAVRAIVELFRLVKREKEVHREILAFSISHDNESASIYGCYPVIDGSKTTYYRHTIHDFYFTTLNGKERWMAYKFTKSIYDLWMPAHLKRLCSAIDAIPSDIEFQLTQGSKLQLSESGLSQSLKSHHVSAAEPRHDDRLALSNS